ncbi:hypothetical protein EYC80_005005 [Monilinia laxa]|uniref:Uncharacterized protein n=1 Tax=Monilinia laxa TaxID=61186 RepID=A0A5N6KIX1_MONLA|nr:hypothetical protein EYC80_005005 [Monilinia laxa]
MDTDGIFGSVYLNYRLLDTYTSYRTCVQIPPIGIIYIKNRLVNIYVFFDKYSFSSSLSLAMYNPPDAI